MDYIIKSLLSFSLEDLIIFECFTFVICYIYVIYWQLNKEEKMFNDLDYESDIIRLLNYDTHERRDTAMDLEKEKNMTDDLHDHKSVIIRTLNYDTHERRDTTIVLKKEKKDDTYYLELTKDQGYYFAFHVFGENVIIGTVVDKNCKYNVSSNIAVILLPNSVKIKIKDPD